MAFPALFLKRNVALLAFVFAFACLGNATTIYNNLNSTTNGGDTIGFLGESFLTGDSAFVIKRVTLKLSAPHPYGFSFTVSLTGPGLAPDTIATLNENSLPTSFGNVPVDLSTPVTLASNTRYWINVFAGISHAQWAWSLDQTARGVAGGYSSRDIGPGIFPNTLGAYQMKVSGADDPPASAAEPGSLFILLVDLSGIGLAWLGRKRIFTLLPDLF